MSEDVPHVPTLRIARPTDQLRAMTQLYAKGLDLDLLGGFEDHDGFDGAMLGYPNCPYHLEFTTNPNHPAGSPPSHENLLIFYIPDATDWTDRCRQMEDAGFKVVVASNPYWDTNGKTFEDPEGYRVVIQNATWPRARDTS